MRILLINPSLKQSNIGHYGNDLEKKRGIYPPLGLAYIASALEHNGHYVYLIDMDATPDATIELIKILRFKPDMICFYVMTWTFRQACKILKVVKDNCSDIISVIGGPHINSFPNESLEYSDFDYAMQGEGEHAIIELIDCIEVGFGFENVDGLIWRKNGVLVNRLRSFLDNLDRISQPSWNLLPINSYWDVFSRHKHFVTMIATRGCPYRCMFCDRKNRMGNQWRTRSPKNVVIEMSMLKRKYGINEFMFFDDNFIIDKRWVREFCDLVKQLKVIWEIRTRVDTVDRFTLMLLKKAGCYRIRYGMESGNNEILKKIKKDITVEQIRHCAIMTKKAGIEIFAYFMMGNPYETEETLQDTIELALDIDAEFIIFSKTILIPGSEIFDWAVEEGLINKDYWLDFMQGKETNPAPVINSFILPDNIINEYIHNANSKFYMRPRYLVNRLCNIRSFHQLVKQAKMAKSLL